MNISSEISWRRFSTNIEHIHLNSEFKEAISVRSTQLNVEKVDLFSCGISLEVLDSHLSYSRVVKEEPREPQNSHGYIVVI